MKNIRIILSALLVANIAYASTVDSKWIRPDKVPTPKDNPQTPQKIQLGKLLYFDTRLSANNDISCATCHHPKAGWSDLIKVPKAVGHEGRVGPRNSPTVLNSAYQYHQFWDGRVKTLEQQALGPIEADVEMNLPLKKALERLNNVKGYKKLFEEVFPGEGITKKTLAKAIASFERTVVSQEAPFDKFIKGDKNAISSDAKKGFEVFLNKAKCVTCHDGFNFTDGSFHNVGLYSGELKGKELGRYLVKKRAAWYGVMKTPTLRDITKSAPYFHNGTGKNLNEVTEVCGNGGKHKDAKNLSPMIVDRKLSKEDVDLIVSFLETLTGPDVPVEIPTSFPN